jgi:bifunctional non-homologous end joining protein LigD
VPSAWDELGAITSGAHWTIRNVLERIEERVDPWRAYARTKQSIAKAMQAIGSERSGA